MAKFLLVAPRFLQQVGEYEPHYVEASAKKPVVVELPDGYKISQYDVGLRSIDAPLEKLKPAHAGTGIVEPAKKAHEGSKAKAGERAADK